MRYLTKFGTELKKQTTIMAERAKSTQIHLSGKSKMAASAILNLEKCQYEYLLIE